MLHKTICPLLVVTLLCACLSVGCATEGEPVELGYGFKTGQTFKLAIEQDLDYTVKVLKTKADAAIDTAETFTFTVIDTGEDGLTTFSITWDEAFFDMSSKELSGSYDSKTGKRGPGVISEALEIVYESLLGVEFQAVMDNDGKVVELVDFEKACLNSIATASMPAGVSPAAIRELLGEVITDQYLVDRLDYLFNFVTKEPMTPGVHIESTRTWSVPIKRKSDEKLRLNSFADGRADLEVSFRFVATAAPGMYEVEGMGVRPHLRGKGRRDIEFKPDSNEFSGEETLSFGGLIDLDDKNSGDKLKFRADYDVVSSWSFTKIGDQPPAKNKPKADPDARPDP